jgi:hypothetical protein
MPNKIENENIVKGDREDEKEEIGTERRNRIRN